MIQFCIYDEDENEKQHYGTRETEEDEQVAEEGARNEEKAEKEEVDNGSWYKHR